MRFNTHNLLMKKLIEFYVSMVIKLLHEVAHNVSSSYIEYRTGKFTNKKPKIKFYLLNSQLHVIFTHKMYFQNKNTRRTEERTSCSCTVLIQPWFLHCYNDRFLLSTFEFLVLFSRRDVIASVFLDQLEFIQIKIKCHRSFNG